MLRFPAIRYTYLTLSLIVLAFSNLVSATEAPLDDRAALTGLSETHAVFDITTENPKKLKFYLELIAESATSVQAQGVKPVFVLAFRGPATRYISSSRDQFDPEQAETADQIAELLDRLAKLPNVTLEQCGVAARVLKVQRDTIHPTVNVVGNSWISLMGYQNRGYALIPVR